MKDSDPLMMETLMCEPRMRTVCDEDKNDVYQCLLFHSAKVGSLLLLPSELELWPNEP